MLSHIKIAGSGRVDKPEKTDAVLELQPVITESLFENTDGNQFFQMLHEYLPEGFFLHVKVQISDLVIQKKSVLQSYRLWKWRLYRKSAYLDYVIADSEGRPQMAIILFKNDQYAMAECEKLKNMTAKIASIPLYPLQMGQNYWFHINRILAFLRSGITAL